ncbi:uncharacterized protein CANTADRAFT_25325 [Suhomyces tanzawaensis NRRL Y-17324]|uniref:Endoplasmic reticulum junction formation protein lunapark n=1 Tax=Suhomyces tanzawaensis NRRL Y-17324 TaxID=984487 RepID=A0A1E4SNH7_9ASCO|nr:uncharacterized protein CANTADRAFT_25325 [Suhomyces tanzawaensis NRRL Y-17324]ODV81055.1 hypothetical protein CANTADRAFT_25325 [Suhomyces tanzawaensis NRRL Y-17324]
MVFGIFSKGFDPESFEKDLTGITDNISHTQQQIAGLQSRSKKLLSALVRYLVLGYIILNIYNYSQVPRGVVGLNKIQIYLKGQSGRQLIFLGLYPVVGYGLVRLIQWVFGVVVNNRTNRLRALRKKHTAKIDELKKITNFNTTNRLLTKYGNEDEKKKDKPLQPASNKPVAKPPATVNNLNARQQEEIAKLNLSKPETIAQNRPGNIGPKGTGISIDNKKPRTVQDRLLDLLIGSDNSESVESRFALICMNCYSHNGLAPPNCADPSQVKYACWKCGVMNGASAWDKELNELKEALPVEQGDSKAVTPEPVANDEQIEPETVEIVPSSTSATSTSTGVER